MDLLLARYSRRDQEARARAERLRALAPLFAEELYRMGADRVVLFGSLAVGKEPHSATDIDLSVEGLSESEVSRARAAFEEQLADDLAWEGDRPKGVDLVRWESAPTRLRARIAQDGKAFLRVAG